MLHWKGSMDLSTVGERYASTTAGFGKPGWEKRNKFFKKKNFSIFKEEKFVLIKQE